MTKNISNLTRRTRAYWFIDGLAEIGSGILFVVLGIPYLLWSLAPQGSALAKIASTGRDVLLLLGIVLLFIVIRVAKQHSTYPRTGYLEERLSGRRQVLKIGAMTLAGVLVFAGLITVGILFFPAFGPRLINGLVYFPTFFGLFLTIVQVVLGFRTDIKRFFVLGGIAALASMGLAVNSFIYLTGYPVDWRPLFASSSGSIPVGLSLAFINLFHSVYQGVAFFGALIGLAMLVSGLVVRRSYLHQNPLPVGAHDED